MNRDHYEIIDNCRTIHERDSWHCCYPCCQNSDIQIAHGIGKGETAIWATMTMWNQEFNESRSYTWIKANVTHNRLNVWTSCSLHNIKFSINIASKPEEARHQLYRIREALRDEGKL